MVMVVMVVMVVVVMVEVPTQSQTVVHASPVAGAQTVCTAGPQSR